MKNMNMKLFTIVFFNCVINTTISLKIYQSNVEFLNAKMVAGLTYERTVLQNQFLSNNFTMCRGDVSTGATGAMAPVDL